MSDFARRRFPGWLHLTIVDAMLVTIVAAVALNIIAAKYIISHGFRPIGFAAFRVVVAGVLFVFLTRALEGSWLLRPGDRWRRVVVSCLVLVVNQLGVVYALTYGTASTAAIILGAGPIFTALFAFLFAAERVGARLGLATVVSFGGVTLIAVASRGGGVSTDFRGVLFALAMTVGWAAYAVVTIPLMRMWSPYRISAVTFLASGLVLLVMALPQLATQSYTTFTIGVWLALTYTVASVLLTSVLYLRAIERVGPSHVALFANLQPFVTVLFAVMVLNESLELPEIVGGAAIAAGVAIAWGSRRSAPLVG